VIKGEKGGPLRRRRGWPSLSNSFDCVCCGGKGRGGRKGKENDLLAPAFFSYVGARRGGEKKESGKEGGGISPHLLACKQREKIFKKKERSRSIGHSSGKRGEKKNIKRGERRKYSPDLMSQSKEKGGEGKGKKNGGGGGEGMAGNLSRPTAPALCP